jgi:hypothetical protein
VDGEQVVLVGNSLGGFNALNTAAQHPELVRGVVLLNAAGRFSPAAADAAAGGEGSAAPAAAAGGAVQQDMWTQLVARVTAAVKRAVVAAVFIWTKQPARILQVLKQVSPSGVTLPAGPCVCVCVRARVCVYVRACACVRASACACCCCPCPPTPCAAPLCRLSSVLPPSKRMFIYSRPPPPAPTPPSRAGLCELRQHRR